MADLRTQLAANLAHVRERITVACQQAGRSPFEVTLVAVTKYAQLEWIEGLIELGVMDLAENRPQQLVERQARWPQVRWHLIGQLQRNKAKTVLGPAALIHSVDSLRLAERLSNLAETPQRILCEVNVSGEATKAGFTPTELQESWDKLLALPNLLVEGLMTMAPLSENPEDARPVFSELRQLRDLLQLRSPQSVSLSHLSMGMSGDYEVAIQEGATLVRVGSRLFEGL
jgi:pyridoxal phosphate enzyme (YggS family)